jgi:hypothetical protein
MNNKLDTKPLITIINIDMQYTYQHKINTCNHLFVQKDQYWVSCWHCGMLKPLLLV